MAKKERKIITLKYERIKHQTKTATLFQFAGGETAWFPDSVTEIDKGDLTVQVPEDLAVDHEVENYAQPV